tara:strand:- start:29529 stop:30464 length:936 start_codon:yes stop_codon:yes gene_type:complete
MSRLTKRAKFYYVIVAFLWCDCRRDGLDSKGDGMTESDVLDQLQGYGLRVDNLEFGLMKRCKVKKGKGEPGWYSIHHEHTRDGRELFFGSYGDWRTGEGAQKIEFDATALTDEERQAFRAKMEADRQAQRQARQQLAAETAARAVKIWGKLPDQGRSEYIRRKRVRAFGLRFSRGSIVVPLRNAQQDLVGLQFIDGEGGKRFLTGTAKKGAWHLVGAATNPERNTLLLAEGYATAASCYMATGIPCAACFDAGNLIHVAKALRTLYPDHQLVICGDDDQDNPNNPGRTQAIAAARAVAGRVVFPQLREVAA